MKTLKNNVKNIIGIILFLSLISCSDTAKWKRELLRLQAYKISLPLQQMRLCGIGADSLKSTFINCRLKLVVYTDSSACSACVLGNMHRWDSLLEKTSVYGQDFRIFFIFSPGKYQKREVEFFLKKENFCYPVWVDNDGVFAGQNPHIPHDPSLHIFLLDENNRVVLAGDPLSNRKIEMLLNTFLKERAGNMLCGIIGKICRDS